MSSNKQIALKPTACLFAGILLPCAFSPLNISVLAVICPAVFVYSLLNISARQAFYQGLLFGIGFFSLGISWIYICLHDFVHTPALFAVLLTALFVFYLALFPALQAYCLARFTQHNKNLLLFFFPVTWVVFEILRSHFLTGFPWLLLGYSQTDGFFSAYLPLLGVVGTGFLMVGCSSALVYIFIHFKNKKIHSALASTLILFFLFLNYPLQTTQWTRPSDRSLTVSLVQSNIAQPDKWSSSFFYQLLGIYHSMTLAHLQSDLIVWPETAIPVSLDQSDSYLEGIDQIARERHTGILYGIPVEAKVPFYYNAIESLGDIKGHYYKKHLVPFGETTPFRNLLTGAMKLFDIPLSDFIQNDEDITLFSLKDVSIAPFICYDIAYSDTLLSQLPEANVLLTINDDSWYGHSWALAQHLQIARARSMEAGREQLFVSNNGMTAIIGADGKIKKALPPYERAVLSGKVTAFEGMTPFVRFAKFFG